MTDACPHWGRAFFDNMHVYLIAYKGIVYSNVEYVDW